MPRPPVPPGKRAAEEHLRAGSADNDATEQAAPTRHTTFDEFGGQRLVVAKGEVPHGPEEAQAARTARVEL